MGGRHFLVVLAHPLPDSYAAALARNIVETLEAHRHRVDLLDLYAENFDPRLTAAERASYMTADYDSSAVSSLIARLQAADGLILVFPQWWFNLPAILKGFIDRVFVPGVAFDHAADGGRLIPRLDHVRTFWAVTTTGSPWWIVHFYMGNPLKRLLKRGVATFCARNVDFRMLCLHDMDRVSAEGRRRFIDTVRAAVTRL